MHFRVKSWIFFSAFVSSYCWINKPLIAFFYSKTVSWSSPELTVIGFNIWTTSSKFSTILRWIMLLKNQCRSISNTRQFNTIVKIIKNTTVSLLRPACNHCHKNDKDVLKFLLFCHSCALVTNFLCNMLPISRYIYALAKIS